MLKKYFRKLFFRLMYLGNPPWESGISPPELIEFIENHPPGRALDLGCGTATNVITLAQHGWQASGIDYIAKPIRIGKRKARQAEVDIDLRVGDVTDLKILGTGYDLVLDMGCYHGIPNSKRVTYRDNLAEIMNLGGTFLLYGMTPTDPNTFPGIHAPDVEGFMEVLELEHRQDGTDRQRISAWFKFKKPASDKK